MAAIGMNLMVIMVMIAMIVMIVMIIILITMKFFVMKDHYYVTFAEMIFIVRMQSARTI